MKRLKVLAVLALVAIPLAGCKTGESCPPIDKSAQLDCVNRVCPVMLEDGVRKDGPRREWRGQRIGFCCEDCLGTWDKWTASERDNAVAKAMARSK